MIPPEDSAQLEAAWRTGEEMIGVGEESVRERVELNKLLNKVTHKGRQKA